MIHVSEFIKEDLIEINYETDTVESVLRYMSQKLCNKGYAKSTFVQAILEREKEFPSALPFEGKAIAIPHTDSIHVLNSVIYFLRLKNPIMFRSMGNPQEYIEVYFISMFAFANKELIGDMLTTLINTYQDNQFLEMLWNSDSQEIYKQLKMRLSQKDTL